VNDVILQDITSDSTAYQPYPYGRAIKCKRDDGVSQRCMPVFENIAFDKDIFANNTCGLNRQSEYCVQTGSSGAKKICDICDNRRVDSKHPAILMTDMNLDETPTWWQSETLLEQKYGTHLILDFKKKYNVAFVRIRFHSIRPHSFSIYKKSTYDPNEAWLPYQFYSRDCQETYGIPNKASVELSNQKIALCTDEFSRMIPLSGGNVAFLTLYNRPGKKRFDEYPELQDWVTVTALRFNFDRLNTFGDEVFGDPKVLKSYYVAVSDIAVGGRCKCNGHASTCDRDNDGNHYCECDHNTAGKDCEKCRPLFNDRPWRRAAGRNANPCRACDCNGLADKCVFDPQLWLDSNQVSGGRCIDCQKNTAGIHCERCKEYHYRKTKDDVCNPCNCNQVGSLSLSCNADGKCACKAGVTGDKCDTCKPGYYGFSASGCRRCNCNFEGSTSPNCEASGQCNCKENVIGKQCNKCAPNFFDLDASNPKGCKSCFCYGHGISCTALKSIGYQGIGKRTISSPFETDFDGWKLEDEYGNDFSQNLEWNIREQYVYAQPIENKDLYFVAPQRYLGDRLTSYTKVLSFVYGIFIRKGDPTPTISRKDIILEGSGLRATYEISAQGNKVPADRFITYKFRLVEPEGMTAFNFQRLLSDLKALKIRVTYLQRRGAIDNIQLESTQYVSLNSPEQVTWQEKCQCKQGYTGNHCKQCDAGFTRAPGTKAPYGKCVPCECNNHGTKCHPETGVCECKDSTTGKNCEICKTGFYGNPTRGNPDDCKPCPCVIAKPGFAKECILIGSRVKCTNCPTGHIGDNCQICSDGYFGDPTGIRGTQQRCQKCDCSGNIDLNDLGNCDPLTGKCLKCVDNTKNGVQEKCEKCADGYFGDALKGSCKSCKCFPSGTKLPAGYKPGQPISCDQNGKCDCRENVIGDRCDTCPAGHWNVASGSGCDKCSCDAQGSLGTDCDIKTGKCKCKPGVAGRTCNQCAAGHYRFSSTGCIACNCNADGSKHENCTSEGVCECLSGVDGIKCDQCPENNYNLSIGCISCPKCFDLVKVAVDDLRFKLRSFNISADISSTGGLQIRDKKFEEKLKELNQLTENLKKKMDDLLKEDNELFKFFTGLKEDLKKLEDNYGELDKMLTKSKGATKSGQNDINKTEGIIEQIKDLLRKIEKRLEEEGERIRKKAETGSSGIGDLSKRMREIAEEARKLADKHEKDSNKIKSTTEKALNSSTTAHETAKDARDAQITTKQDLERMERDSNEAKLLAKESEKLINQAKKSVNESLTDSAKLIDEAKKPLPDLDADATNDAASNLMKQSKDVDTTANKVYTDNKPAITKLDADDVEARDLMARGLKLRNDSDDLYQKAKDANEQAKKAQEEGKRVAKEAKEMLETLEGFESTIAMSKANATNAKKLIPRIKELIKSANTTAHEAAKNADMSESDSRESFEKITSANSTVVNTKMEADDILAEAKKLLLDLINFTDNDIKNTQNDIDNVQINLTKYSDQAKKDAVEVQKADQDSEKAFQDTSSAQEALGNALQDVEDLLTAINNLGDIDLATLAKAEKDLKNAETKLDGQLSTDISLLEKRLAEQERNIQTYELDLTELKKQLNHSVNVLNFMPRTCFKVKGGIE